MMAGEIQEPFSLSLLENSIHTGSISFGRFEKESLSWEKRSSFSHNRYLEEAEKFSKPGSVTQMRAHFEAHFKKKGIRFPSSVEAQSWGEVVHHQTCTEKDENLLDNTSQFGDSCVSYDDILANSDDERNTSISVALEKTEIGCNEDEKEATSSSSATRSKPLKNVQKAISYSLATKTSTKKNVVITKASPSCNTKTSIDTKRQNELKPKRIVKTIASQAPTTSKKTESLTPLVATTSKKTESLTPLVATREKKTESLTPLVATREKKTETLTPLVATREKKTESLTPLVATREKKTESLTPLVATKEKKTTTNAFSFRSNERAEKRKEEKVEATVHKALNLKTRPMPKSTQSRPKHTSTGQAKGRDDHSSTATCDRSVTNGTAKSKLMNVNKQKVDIKRSLNGIRPKTSDQTTLNNMNRRNLVVRRSVVEVAL